MSACCPYILEPKNIDRHVTTHDIGGKALQLRNLQRTRINVPPWCVVTTAAFQQALAPYQRRISELCDQITADSPDSVRRASREITELLRNLSIPAELQRQIHFTTYRLFGVAGRLAVRSSAACEDSSADSFAGQFDSFLNVSPEQVGERIIDVWRSAFSERVLLYRVRKNLGVNCVDVAVIIQEMIFAQCSGVLFTRSPESDEPEMLIEAAYGIGEGVVANHADTDSYRCRRSGFRFVRHIRRKQTHVGLSPSGAIERRPVPESMQDKPVLTFRRILELRSIGIELERLCGAPQDIEWSYDDNGRLYILQSRPITPRHTTTGSQSYRVWDNANIVESYPGLTLPLTFSFISTNYEHVFRNAACGLVWSKRNLAARDDIWKNMVGLIHGRVYYNLLNWYAMLSHLPGFHRHHAAWDQMIGIRKRQTVKSTPLPWYNSIYARWAVLREMLFINRTSRRFMARFNPLYACYRQWDFATMSESELIDCFGTMQRELMGFWHLTLYADFSAMKYYDWLLRLCRRWCATSGRNLHSDLLCGESGIESVGPVRSAVALAEVIRNNPAYRALFHSASDADVWQIIAANREYLPLREQCLCHLERYGDRCAEELKLETRTPREEPAQLIAIIRAYIDSDLTVESLATRERQKRSSAEASLYRQVRNPFKRLLISFIVRQARRAVANRENMRFARTRAYGVSRALFRQFGALLTQRQVIDSPDDIAYLTIPELFGFINATTVTTDLRAIISSRREEYLSYAKVSLPDRFETLGAPFTFNPQNESVLESATNSLTGIGCSSGIAEGRAQVVRHPGESSLTPGQILVAESTDPSWVFLMLNSSGIVVERGSVLSHTAIIGRELGIPTIVGVPKASRLIPPRSRLRINGATGEVAWSY